MAQPSLNSILVVDDNTDYANSMVRLLGMLGYSARSAFSGTQAMAMFIEERPQLVLLDINLPDISGYSVAKLIRDIAGDDVQLIAITGWGKDFDYHEVGMCHFDGCFKKPVPIHELSQYLLKMPT